MGARVRFTEKQQRQIVSFFEKSHRQIAYSDTIENCGIIALFRACRDYCTNMARCGRGCTPDELRAQYRKELINRLDKLSIRYYERL